MFYCEACRINNDWPTSLGRSHGKCGCCNIVAECYDRPSSSLPLPATKAAEDPEWPFELTDLRIDTYRIDSGGGFSLNKADSAVRIRHLPSGLEASSSEDRSQHHNKAEAMKLLAVMVSKWKANGRLDGVEDSDDPLPDYTDAELGFAYRMMIKAHHRGLVVNFVSGDISLPKNKR